MKRASGTKPILVGALLGVMLTGQAMADNIRYRQSGDWFDTEAGTGGLNGWQPPGLPGLADQARINWGNNTVTLADDAGTVGRLYIGVDEPGNLVINLGGVLTAGRSGIADSSSIATSGTLTINGGALTINTSRWDMGVSDYANTATVTINSGSMRVMAPFRQNKATTTATTTVNGGELWVNSLELTTGVVNIAGGVLKVGNLTEDVIDGWIATGLMVFYGKTSGVKDVDYSLAPFENGFAITAIPAASSFKLTITPAVSPATGYDLKWESQDGMLYNLRSSTDLNTSISTWDLIEGNLSATPPNNLQNVAADGLRRFYVVEEFPVPPTERHFEKP